jgi:hypothetical protein
MSKRISNGTLSSTKKKSCLVLKKEWLSGHIYSSLKPMTSYAISALKQILLSSPMVKSGMSGNCTT